MSVERDHKNDTYVVVTSSGNDLTDADRTACLALLARGGAVNVGTATRELPRATGLYRSASDASRKEHNAAGKFMVRFGI